MPNKKQPSVVVLTSEDLENLLGLVQAGFTALNERLDSIEARLTPVTEVVHVEPVTPIDKAAGDKRTRTAARQALKDSVTRPAPRRRGA